MQKPERQVGSLTISYTIEEDGHMSTTYEHDGELSLIIQLGLLRLAEDTAIRLSMNEPVGPE